MVMTVPAVLDVLSTQAHQTSKVLGKGTGSKQALEQDTAGYLQI